MRTLVLGDLHGAAWALEQVWERSAFDPARDRLVFIGDVCDGWPDVRECVDLLLTCDHLVALLGNHDDWFLDYIRTAATPATWTSQGGVATLQSYVDGVPARHIRYFEQALLYFQQTHFAGESTEVNRLFVHAGVIPARSLREQPRYTLLWDRSMWSLAKAAEDASNLRGSITTYGEVFIGHTVTDRYSDVPIRCCEVWNVDQGAGWTGRLSLMDVDTKEYWQSDPVRELYPAIARSNTV